MPTSLEIRKALYYHYGNKAMINPRNLAWNKKYNDLFAVAYGS